MSTDLQFALDEQSEWKCIPILRSQCTWVRQQRVPIKWTDYRRLTLWAMPMPHHFYLVMLRLAVVGPITDSSSNQGTEIMKMVNVSVFLKNDFWRVGRDYFWWDYALCCVHENALSHWLEVEAKITLSSLTSWHVYPLQLILSQTDSNF